MSKKLNHIDINECAVGDICWMIIQQFSKPVSGEISEIVKSQNAIQISTDNHGFRLALCTHCFWKEEDAKDFRKKIKN